MLAPSSLSAEHYRLGGRLRELLLAVGFLGATLLFSVVAFRGGVTTLALLLLGMVGTALTAVIFWRPVIGLYMGVFLDLAMDPSIQGDPISKYTDYFHQDLNTTIHAGIAFSPLELLLIITSLAYLLRAVTGYGKLNGGTLGRHVAIFGLFLVAGYFWGVALNHGDPKIGLFEVRAPFMLVLLYFLVTNLAVEEHQLTRLLGWIMAGIGVLAVWGALRFFVFFHGNAGGPDGAFGATHENAVFLSLFAVVWLVRVIFGGTTRRRTWGLLLLVPPALFTMFEMERRAAFFCLMIALVVLAVALFYHRRRVFFAIVPAAGILLVIYAAVFWNSSSKLAQPIRAWRTQSASAANIDPRDLSSNLYRINEKADVRDTIMLSPLTGVGFGRMFHETHPLVHLPYWPFQFYTPHIEVMWIWLKVGAGGFVAFWLILCAALLRAAGIVRVRSVSSTGFVSLVAALFIVMLLVYAYVDIGLANQRCEILLGAMVGIIGRASWISAPCGADEVETRPARRNGIPCLSS